MVDFGDGLYEKLLRYAKDGALPFHMPGHKRNAKYTHMFGAQSMDITEIDGFDNLHAAKGVIKYAQDRAARVFGSENCRFSVGGGSACVLAGMRALTEAGDRVLVARNCHKSVFSAIELLRLKAGFVLPDFLPNGFYGHVRPESVRVALEKYGDVKLVVLTSPTYEGVVSDVKGIADICCEKGAYLLVDEAHGAHFGFGKFPVSARALGADITVNSLHKTLPCLTQTALLHFGERVDACRVDESLAMFETSSPSYILMGAIDGCCAYLNERGEEEANEWYNAVIEVRQRLKGLKNLRLFCPTAEEAFCYDASKLVIDSRFTTLCGAQLAKILLEKYNAALEMAGENYVVAMTGMGDTKDNLESLADALEKADRELEYVADVKSQNVWDLPEKAFELYETDSLSYECVNLAEADGRVSAENIWAYPPGCPIVCKGEILQKDTLLRLVKMKADGMEIERSFGDFDGSVRVVK